MGDLGLTSVGRECLDRFDDLERVSEDSRQIVNSSERCDMIETRLIDGYGGFGFGFTGSRTAFNRRAVSLRKSKGHLRCYISWRIFSVNFRMEPILVCPLIYVLECVEGKYYVGITHDLNRRLAQHISGHGALWTRLWKPVKVVEIIHEGATLALENDTTKRYMELYGRENVRGGSFCKP